MADPGKRLSQAAEDQIGRMIREERAKYQNPTGQRGRWDTPRENSSLFIGQCGETFDTSQVVLVQPGTLAGTSEPPEPSDPCECVPTPPDPLTQIFQPNGEEPIRAWCPIVMVRQASVCWYFRLPGGITGPEGTEWAVATATQKVACVPIPKELDCCGDQPQITVFELFDLVGESRGICEFPCPESGSG